MFSAETIDIADRHDRALSNPITIHYCNGSISLLGRSEWTDAVEVLNAIRHIDRDEIFRKDASEVINRPDIAASFSRSIAESNAILATHQITDDASAIAWMNDFAGRFAKWRSTAISLPIATLGDRI